MSANIDKWHLGKEQKINVGMRELNFNKDKRKQNIMEKLTQIQEIK